MLFRNVATEFRFQKHVLGYWCNVINSIEKLILSQLLKKSGAFYEIHRFIIVYTGTRYWSQPQSISLVHMLRPYFF
jgi:hypothetical protein